MLSSCKACPWQHSVEVDFRRVVNSPVFAVLYIKWWAKRTFRVVWNCWAEKSLQWNFIVECCKKNDCSKDFTTQEGSVRTGIKILCCWRDEIECVLVLPVPAESRCRFLSCFLFWNGLRIGGFGQCLFCFSLSTWVFSFPERPCPAAFHSLASPNPCRIHFFFSFCALDKAGSQWW